MRYVRTVSESIHNCFIHMTIHADRYVHAPVTSNYLPRSAISPRRVLLLRLRLSVCFRLSLSSPLCLSASPPLRLSLSLPRLTTHQPLSPLTRRPFHPTHPPPDAEMRKGHYIPLASINVPRAHPMRPPRTLRDALHPPPVHPSVSRIYVFLLPMPNAARVVSAQRQCTTTTATTNPLPATQRV